MYKKSQFERNAKIKRIREAIKANPEVPRSELIVSIMRDFMVSRRIALEYLEVAQSE